jgi:hypothetical protein
MILLRASIPSFQILDQNLAEKIGSTECLFKYYLDKTNSEFTAFKSFSVNHVCHLLRELSGSKATDLDKISNKIINIAAPLISDSLTYIFNQAIALCIFPHKCMEDYKSNSPFQERQTKLARKLSTNFCLACH